MMSPNPRRAKPHGRVAVLAAALEVPDAANDPHVMEPLGRAETSGHAQTAA